MMSASGVTPVEIAEQQRFDDLADHQVAGDDPAQHQEGLRPARRDGEGDQGGQHGAQRRADVGHEAQRAGKQAPEHGVGHAEREQAQPDQHGETEVGEEAPATEPGPRARRRRPGPWTLRARRWRRTAARTGR